MFPAPSHVCFSSSLPPVVSARRQVGVGHSWNWVKFLSAEVLPGVSQSRSRQHLAKLLCRPTTVLLRGEAPAGTTLILLEATQNASAVKEVVETQVLSPSV